MSIALYKLVFLSFSFKINAFILDTVKLKPTSSSSSLKQAGRWNGLNRNRPADGLIWNDDNSDINSNTSAGLF